VRRPDGHPTPTTKQNINPMTLKRLITSLLTAAIIIAIPSIAVAGGKGDKPVKGTVSAVDLKANTITITKKKSSETPTFKVADAKITIEGAPGKLADITVGMRVSVTVGSTPDTATEIEVSTHKKKGEGKHSTPPAPAAPTPAPAPVTSGTTGA
jgi:hypothetical protein